MKLVPCTDILQIFSVVHTHTHIKLCKTCNVSVQIQNRDIMMMELVIVIWVYIDRYDISQYPHLISLSHVYVHCSYSYCYLLLLIYPFLRAGTILICVQTEVKGKR